MRSWRLASISAAPLNLGMKANGIGAGPPAGIGAAFSALVASLSLGAGDASWIVISIFGFRGRSAFLGEDEEGSLGVASTSTGGFGRSFMGRGCDMDLRTECLTEPATD